MNVHQLVLIGMVALPLLVAGVLVLTRGASQPDLSGTVRWAGRLTAAAQGAGALVLLLRAVDDGPTVVQVGGWVPGVAIPLAADGFGSVVALAVAVVVLAGLVHARGTGEDRAPLLVPLVLVVQAGVNGALFTADLFNLFVFVEIMLVPSYVLLFLGRRRTHARMDAARVYVAVNLLASTIFLAGVALVYASTGTVQLGELAQLPRTPELDVAVWFLLLPMAFKCGAVPLHGWLPRSYAVAGPAVVAIFSGLLTKTGLVVLIRLDALLVPDGSAVAGVVLVVALLSASVGVLLAVGSKGMRAVLAAHMVSQVGFLLAGVGLVTTLGLAASVFFLVQYVVVKAALFMVSGAVETRYGTDELSSLGGLAHREPVLALAFALSAAALVGLPPTSGFVGKLQVLTAAVGAGAYVTVAVLVVVSLLTLTSMLKVWNGVFWGPADDAPRPLATRAAGLGAADGLGLAGPAQRDEDARESGTDRRGGGVGSRERGTRDDGQAPAAAASRATRAALVGPPLVLGVVALLLGVGAEPLLAVADQAAAGLADPGAWAAVVTGPPR
ncbi:proton-conducting transporter transmembrane domain-containing protein [Pseudokineococcus sp. 1T1Z-3]|uniref:proton-conducting transporter transmembrane domain-containing protein n=1 Tax=Pseudokineococcus sp. 1T1Z-3 TaxID=3132745 RepID=UPI0030A5DD8F